MPTAKITHTILLTALSCGSLFLTPCSPAAGQEPKDFREKLFPDGLTHDFGVVQRGTQAYHAFRIVNTSDAALRIANVRFG